MIDAERGIITLDDLRDHLQLPVDWRAASPMTPDPAAQAYRGTWAYQPMMAFSAAYTALVDTRRAWSTRSAAAPKPGRRRYGTRRPRACGRRRRTS